MNDLTNRRTDRPRLRAAAAITGALTVAMLTVSTGAAAGATEAPPTIDTTAPETAPMTTPSTTAPVAPDETVAPPTTADEAPPAAAPVPPSSDALSPKIAETRAAVTAAATTPTVNVTPTTGLNPAGGSTISVSGSGFSPTANSGFGVYAVFGPVDPGTYFEDANRFLAAVWLHTGGGASGSPGQAELNADGTFATTLPPAGALPLTAQYTDGNGAAVNCLTTQCYVITIAAHGVSDRSQDTCTPISFAGGTATPGVDAKCRPVSAPTGQPNNPGANNNTTGSGNVNGTNTGANRSGGGANTTGASGSSSTLPKTGSGVAALGGLGLSLVATGLLLVQRSRRQLAKTPLTVPVSRLDRRP